jgi:hypothetical protein
MSDAGWGRLWDQALALLGAEPVFLRILIGTIAAFCAVVFLEGLRACFLPGYRKGPAMTLPAPKPVATASGQTSAVFAPPKAVAPFRPRTVDGKSVNRKKLVRAVSRAHPERPKIRRFALDYAQYSPVPMFTDEAAPYSPVKSAPYAV